MVGQICREGMDETGILPKARYAMTVCHCLEQLLVWGDGEGRCKPPSSGSKAEPWWGPGDEVSGSSSDPAVHGTKECLPKTTFLVHFICVLHKN